MGIAISTAGVTFGYAVETTAGTRPVKDYTLIPDIKEIPELNPSPETLETTTLAETEFKTYIEGLKDLGGALSFTANYTAADFKACNDDADKGLYYSLEFSDGSKFTWQGKHTMGLPGKGVDEVIEMTINVVPSTDIAFSQGI